MRYMRARILGAVITLVFIGLTWLGWHQLFTDGRYSLKLAAFSPVGIVGGLFLLAFPSLVIYAIKKKVSIRLGMDIVAPALILFRQERATANGPHSQHVEVISRDQFDLDPLLLLSRYESPVNRDERDQP